MTKEEREGGRVPRGAREEGVVVECKRERNERIDRAPWRGYGTGGRIWSSSKVLREFLKESGDVFVLDKNVVELGRGQRCRHLRGKTGSGEKRAAHRWRLGCSLELAEENASKMASRISPCISRVGRRKSADAEIG